MRKAENEVANQKEIKTEVKLKRFMDAGTRFKCIVPLVLPDQLFEETVLTPSTLRATQVSGRLSDRTKATQFLKDS